MLGLLPHVHLHARLDGAPITRQSLLVGFVISLVETRFCHEMVVQITDLDETNNVLVYISIPTRAHDNLNKAIYETQKQINMRGATKPKGKVWSDVHHDVMQGECVSHVNN